MGKSVRNNEQSNGIDFDAAFDQAVTEAPIEEKPQKGKASEKKAVATTAGFDFDAAFETAVKKKEEPTAGANAGTGTTNTSPSKLKLPSGENKQGERSQERYDALIWKKEKSGGLLSDAEVKELSLLKEGENSPFAFKRTVQNGGLSRVSQELRGQRNFENKKLTEDDVDVLATTKYGTERGLENVAASPAAKKYFISAHNGKKESDLINSITPFLPQDNPELFQSILNGDVSTLNTYKTDYFAGIDKKIGEIENPGNVQNANYGSAPIPLTDDQQQYINKLRADRDEAEKVFSQYAQNALVNKRVNLLMAEGTEAGLSPGMLAKEVGKEIEQQILPNKYFQQREEVYQQFKTFPLLQKEAGEVAKGLPERFKKDIDERLKTLKDNQLYAKENIEYDRENIGLNAILENISMKANDLIAKGIATNDTDLLQKGNDLLDRYTHFKNEKDNLLDKYPDVGIAQTAQILSDRISSGKGMRPVFITNSDIAKAAAEEEKTTGKFMEKYGKFVNYVSPASLPKGGFMGGLNLGLDAIGQRWFGEGSDVEEVARSYNPALKTTAQAGGQPIRIAYDNEGKAYREMENENYQTWDFNNSMRVVGQGLPSLAEFILLERGFGKLAGLAGSAGVGTLSKVAQISSKVSKASVTAEELAATREALRFSQGLKNTLGLTGAMYVTSYDHNRQLADELIEGTSGKDEFQKDVLANALTLLSVAAFKAVGYSPSKAVQRSFAKGIAPDAMSLLERQGLEGLGKEETNKLFKDIILPKAQAAVKSLGVSLKGGATGAAAVVLDENMKGLLGSIINPEKGKLPTAQEDVDAAISQVMLMTAVGLPGMVMGKTKSTLTKDALYEAGLRSPQFEGFINKEVENGRYTQEQANEMISIIKTMGQEAYKAQSETTENGLPLTVKQKRDLAFNNFRVRAAKMLEEKGHKIKSPESEVNKENNEIKKNPRFEEVNVETDADGNITVLEKNKSAEGETPEQTIINKAGQDKLGVYSTMVKSDPNLAVDVLRDVAQQMYGINDKGEPLEGGSRRGGLSLQFDTDIMEAAEKKFPSPESTLIKEGISEPKTNQNGNEKTSQEGGQKSSEESSRQETGSEDALRQQPELVKEGAAETSETQPAPLSEKPRVRVSAEELKAGQPKKEGDMTSITHARMNELAEEFGFPSYEKDTQTIKGWDEQATERIKKDPDALNKLMNKMRDEGMPSPVEQRMMLQYISSLRAKVRTNPTPENLKELNRAKDISNIVGGRFVGQSLVARKGEKPTEDTLDNYLEQWTEAHGTETLPKETIDELSSRFEKEQDLKLKIDEAYEKGRQAALKEKAEEEVKKSKPGSNVKRKSKEQFVEERKSLAQQLKEQKEKHEKYIKDQGIHYSGFGFTLTGEMAKTIGKIAKSYIHEGAQKLEQVIEKVYSEIKDIFPDVTKNDIRDVMAGVYKEKKETKNELAERVRNLETEAKLLNQIENERKGIEKIKIPADKTKANKRIEELRKRVDVVRKLKKSELEEEGVKDMSEMGADDLSKLKKQRLTQIENLREKIKNKDYSLPEPPPKRIKLDKEAQRLEDEYEKMKEKDLYQQEKAKYDRLSKGTKRWDQVWKVLGLKRIVQTALDFSIPFRQNITTTINPLKWLPRIEEGKLKTPTNIRQFKNMFSFTFVPRLMREYEKNLKETGEWHEMNQDGISFSNPSETKLSQREEDFRNNIFEGLRSMRGDKNKVKNVASYIGEPIFASERAAAGALNTIRVERYRAAKRNLEAEGITRQNDPEAYKKMAEWVMNMTGRGKMLEMIENSKTGKTLAGNTFYGARLMASRFNLLKNPFFSKMPTAVRKEAFKDMAGYVGGVTMTGMALMAAGGNVSFNPDDPDFLQVRFGKTKYDISGGMTAYIRTFLRLSKAAMEQGKAVGGTKSETKKANKYSGFATRTGATFITNKFAPNTAYAYHFLTGKSPSKDNKQFDPYEFFQFYPMYVSDIKDAWAEEGVSSLLSVGLPNVLGIGTQTYEN